MLSGGFAKTKHSWT